MNIILEATPIVSDGPAWVIGAGLVANVIKEFVPVFGKKFDSADCKKKLQAVQDQLDAIQVEYNKLKNSQNTINGYLFVVRQKLSDLGYPDLDILLKKLEDEQ